VGGVFVFLGFFVGGGFFWFFFGVFFFWVFFEVLGGGVVVSFSVDHTFSQSLDWTPKIQSTPRIEF